jgi:very-short-patch-repair endonuclease
MGWKLRRGLRLDEFVQGYLSSPRRGKKGARMIKSVLESRRMESGVPEEAFERRFLLLVRKAGLILPVSQYRLRLQNGSRVRIDFAYPELKIAIEAQSYSWHSDRHSWERNRARVSELASVGWLVIEVTWRQLSDDPGAVVARLSRALELRSGS